MESSVFFKEMEIPNSFAESSKRKVWWKKNKSKLYLILIVMRMVEWNERNSFSFVRIQSSHTIHNITTIQYRLSFFFQLKVSYSKWFIWWWNKWKWKWNCSLNSFYFQVGLVECNAYAIISFTKHNFI